MCRGNDGDKRAGGVGATVVTRPTEGEKHAAVGR